MEKLKMTYIKSIDDLNKDKFYLTPYNGLWRGDTKIVYIHRTINDKEEIIKTIKVSINDFISYIEDNYLELFEFVFNQLIVLGRFGRKYTYYWEVPEDMYRYFELINTLNN